LLARWFVECLRRESLGGGQRPQHVYQKRATQKSQPVKDRWPILCAAHARSDLGPIRLARTHQLQPPRQLPQIRLDSTGIESLIAAFPASHRVFCSGCFGMIK
jgi:hypothetical protein